MVDRWLSPAGLDLAERLLAYDPAKRATALQALDAPYFCQEEPPAAAPVGYVYRMNLTGNHVIDSITPFLACLLWRANGMSWKQNVNELKNAKGMKALHNESIALHIVIFSSHNALSYTITHCTLSVSLASSYNTHQACAVPNLTRPFSVSCCTIDSTFDKDVLA